MNNEKHLTGLEIERSLREAVYEELAKKAKLGQYVIINRDGKPCRVPAEEAIKEAEAGLRKYDQAD